LRVAGEPDPPVVSGDARRSGRGCPSWTVCRWRPCARWNGWANSERRRLPHWVLLRADV